LSKGVENRFWYDIQWLIDGIPQMLGHTSRHMPGNKRLRLISVKAVAKVGLLAHIFEPLGLSNLIQWV
jgi:hypothetical protein